MFCPTVVVLHQFLPIWVTCDVAQLAANTLLHRLTIPARCRYILRRVVAGGCVLVDASVRARRGPRQYRLWSCQGSGRRDRRDAGMSPL
jgi:hypothetical protein